MKKRISQIIVLCLALCLFTGTAVVFAQDDISFAEETEAPALASDDAEAGIAEDMPDGP